MLKDYNTIILDLDDTVWFGSETNFWAKRLRGDLQHRVVDGTERIYDETGRFLSLSSDFKVFLKTSLQQGKTIGFLSRGKLLGIPFDLQPSVRVLKMFGLLEFFNICDLVHKDENKAHWIRPHGETIFVDDNEKDLTCVRIMHPSIKCIDRAAFANWMELYENSGPIRGL
jgi:hypothetical protein